VIIWQIPFSTLSPHKIKKGKIKTTITMIHQREDPATPQSQLRKSIEQLMIIDRLVVDNPKLIAELNEQGAIHFLMEHIRSPVILQALTDLCPQSVNVKEHPFGDDQVRADPAIESFLK
jgi:hypothetical protein